MDVIVNQGPGYTIARTNKASTLVPYGRADRASGDINHGWLDLRDHPERVGQVPEAAKSAGLARLLRVIADPVSKVMSSACECAAFKRAPDDDEGQNWQVGGFVITMFKDGDRNTDPDALIELASYLLQGIAPTESHHMGFEMLVEPLRLFFGRTDCFALTIKPHGFGASENEAWLSFDYACDALASAVERDRPKT